MNSDPRLEFGMGTPRVQEMAAPDMQEVLQAVREPMRRMMGVESDQDWQVCVTTSRPSPCPAAVRDSMDPKTLFVRSFTHFI